MGWREFSEWNYDKWGKKLQPMYNRIDDWQTPEWAKQACQKLWDVLDSKTKDKLYKFVYEICDKFDEEFAKELIEDVMNKILTKLGLKD